MKIAARPANYLSVRTKNRRSSLSMNIVPGIAAIIALLSGPLPNAEAQTIGRIPAWPSEVPGEKIIGPYLWRNHLGPDVILSSRNEKPVFDWQQLLAWNCSPKTDDSRRAKWARRYMDGTTLVPSDIRWTGVPSTEPLPSRQYTVTFNSGDRNDVWYLQGITASPVKLDDGSKVESGCIEELITPLTEPSNGEQRATLSYSHGVGHDCLRYYKRLLPNGKLSWSRVFLIKGEGTLTDRTEYAVEEDPVLELFDIRAMPATDMGILSSWTPPSPKLPFGDISAGVNLISGELLSHDLRIVSAQADDVAAIFRKVLIDVSEEGRTESRNTTRKIRPTKAKEGVPSPIKLQRSFDRAIREALVNAYFK